MGIGARLAGNGQPPGDFMKNASLCTCLFAAMLLTFAGCSTAPDSQVKKEELRTSVDNTMKRIETLDPSLQKRISSA